MSRNQRLRRARPVLRARRASPSLTGAIVGAPSRLLGGALAGESFVAGLERTATTRGCTPTSSPAAPAPTSRERVRRRATGRRCARRPRRSRRRRPATRARRRRRVACRCACARACSARSRCRSTLRTVVASEGDAARRLVALAGVPGPAPRRAADAPHDAAARARRCSRATARVLAESPRPERSEAGRAARRSANSPSAVVGEVGPIPASRRAGARSSRACPPDADRRHRAGSSARSTPACAGTPGGELLGRAARVLASTAPRRGARRAHDDLAGRAATPR